MSSRFEPSQEDFEAMAQYGSMFPVSHLPAPLKRLIVEGSEKLGFPVDYFTAAVLTAVATAIGNQCVVEVKPNWIEKAVLYTVIVGSAGANKSHPMSFAMKPLIDRDVEYLKEYKAEMKNYDDGLISTKPKLKRRVVSDTTIEGLVSLHAANPNGLILYADELKSWISNFTRYSGGSQEQFWLTNFSSKPIIVDRKDSERSTLVEDPFICVMGSTQPKVLHSFTKGDRAYNGFIDRLLFAVLEKVPKPYWSTESIDPEVSAWYDKFIKDILGFEGSLRDLSIAAPFVCRFSASAFELLLEWQRYNADLVNQSDDETTAGMQTKLESYAVRFCLLAHIIRFYSTTEVEDVGTVDQKSVDLGVRITEYFRAQAFSVRKLLDNSVRDALPRVDADFIDSLPSAFDYEDIVKAAEKVGISRTSAYRLISKYDGTFVAKLGRNSYTKLD